MPVSSGCSAAASPAARPSVVARASATGSACERLRPSSGGSEHPASRVASTSNAGQFTALTSQDLKPAFTDEIGVMKGPGQRGRSAWQKDKARLPKWWTRGERHRYHQHSRRGVGHERKAAMTRYVYIALIVILVAVVLLFKVQNMASVTVSLFSMQA